MQRWSTIQSRSRARAPAWLPCALGLLTACQGTPVEEPREGAVTYGEVQVPIASSTTTAFQDGVAPYPSYAGSRDTHLAASQASTAYGGTTTCRVDGDDPQGTGKDVVSLLAWQLSGIPSGSVVTGATLQLSVNDTSSGTWSLYALGRAWSEKDATWNVAEPGTPWDGPGASGGGDRKADLLASFTLAASGKATIPLNAAGLAQVQAWLDDPDSNHGLILVGPSSNGAAFASREASNASARPRLEVQWAPAGATSSSTLIAKGASWKYLDTGVEPGIAWKSIGFTETGWKSGPAELGYGDGDEATVVSFGADPLNKPLTVWFRHTFQVPDPSAVASLLLQCKRDDGVVVYLNGVEVMRSNMPTGTPTATTKALSSIEDENWYQAPVDPSLLVAGANVLSAEVHQAQRSSSDLGFDLSLEAVVGGQTSPGVLIPAGSPWRYLDDGSDPGSNWWAVGFDDAGWLKGLAELGYGDGDEATVIGYGGSSTNKVITARFRNTFDVPVASAWQTLRLKVKADDGVLVFLNGKEAYRFNLPSGAIGPGTLASKALENAVWHEAPIDPALLQDGANVIAAEVHQVSGTSSDLSFDLVLEGDQKASPCQPLDCDDDNPCTTDVCDPAVGCGHTPAAGTCDDGNACTSGDTCKDGGCLPGELVVCDDSDPCTASVCDTLDGCTNPALSGTPCDDNNPCTKSDACAAGTCVGAPVPCDDKNPCTTDACQVSTGACAFTPNSAPCNDANACTSGDVCSGGSCQPGAAATNCDDGNLCTDDGCSPASGCVYAFNTKPCTDGSTCTSGEACQGGTCKPASEVNCDDLNPCTTDVCDASLGCTHTANTATCDDGSVCTTSDTCSGGACVGTAVTCSDGNVCTTDACDAATGCKFTNNTVACSDGSACTIGDVCSGGACQAGAPKVCVDGNPCTADSCTASTGKCVYTATSALEGSACTPSSGCTIGVCQTGTCMSSGCGIEPWPWQVPSTLGPAKTWFDPVGVHEVQITLPASDWERYLDDVESANTETWYKANVVIDGKTYSNVGIRAFGAGSMISNPGKPNIRIKFGEFVKGQLGPDGLKNVRFKASGQDATFLREPLIYGISRALGGAAPRSSWGRVWVNGEAYGPFIVLEHVDEDFLLHHFGNNTATFFEGEKSCIGVSCPGGVCQNVLTAYKLSSGTGAEMVSLASAIKNGSDSEWVNQVKAVADMPQMLVFWAMDVLTSNVDGLTAAGNNYDAYYDKLIGRLVFIHHGMDLTLGNWSAWYSWYEPWGPPCSWCKWPEEVFYARLVETASLKAEMWDLYKAAHCGPFSTATVLPLVDKMKALIGPDIYNDPKGIKTKSQIDSSFSVLKTYVTDRNKSLDSLVGTCP